MPNEIESIINPDGDNLGSYVNSIQYEVVDLPEPISHSTSQFGDFLSAVLVPGEKSEDVLAGTIYGLDITQQDINNPSPAELVNAVHNDTTPALVTFVQGYRHPGTDAQANFVTFIRNHTQKSIVYLALISLESDQIGIYTTLKGQYLTFNYDPQDTDIEAIEGENKLSPHSPILRRDDLDAAAEMYLINQRKNSSPNN